jgi:phosphoribosylformimino-5-aminoimidazole carboxamide ribotide isomerase
MRIIPAIDIIDGKCVRLTQGNYQTKKTYHDNPVEMAKLFQDHGVRYLHLVDLDGARSSQIVNYRILEQIATKTKLKIDFGGGLKSDADLKIAFESGASQITGGTIAVKNKELFLTWIEKYGSDRIILGSDVQNGMIAVSGWEESTSHDLIPFIVAYLKMGIRYTICTDTALDGMLEGPSVSLYREILESTQDFKPALIASGGIRNTDDLNQLKEIGCEGAIIGKAIYEGTLPLGTLEKYLALNPQL